MKFLTILGFALALLDFFDLSAKLELALEKFRKFYLNLVISFLRKTFQAVPINGSYNLHTRTGLFLGPDNEAKRKANINYSDLSIYERINVALFKLILFAACFCAGAAFLLPMLMITKLGNNLFGDIVWYTFKYPGLFILYTIGTLTAITISSGIMYLITSLLMVVLRLFSRTKKGIVSSIGLLIATIGLIDLLL